MEYNEYRYDYSERKEFNFLFVSDPHFEDIVHDSALWESDMARGEKEGAEVFIGGDLFSAITYKDPRYVPGMTKAEREEVSVAETNRLIDLGIQKLTPIGARLKQLNTGNHESMFQKYHGSDLIAFLLRYLNLERRSPPYIIHGGYEGFIRLKFERGKGASRNLVIYYNHGQGGSAEVTRGAIDLDRRVNIRADFVWLSHKHTKIIHDLAAEIGVSVKGYLYEKTKVGFITGSYLGNISKYNIKKNNYRVSFSEEKFRRPLSKGGVLLRVNLTGGNIKCDLVLPNAINTVYYE